MNLLAKIGLAYQVTKGGEIVIDVYVTLIMHHSRTIDKVPAQLQADVLADLAAMGLDGNGNPLPQPAEPTA